MEDNRPDKGHQAKNSPHYKGKGKGKAIVHSHAESARLVREVALSRKPIDEEVARQFSPEWGDASLLAETGGLDAIAGWLQVIRRRYVGDPITLAAIIEAWEAAASDTPVPVVEPPKPPRYKTYTASELARADFRKEWLCRGVLVRGQPGVVGGPKKGQKTTMMFDLAISLASGTPFLGHFDVGKPRNVLFMSGESGGATLQDTMFRICNAKDIGHEILDGRFVVSEDLPRLSLEEDLQALEELIRENRAEVIFIDPLYLSLIGGPRQVEASNLYETGPLFASVAKRCLAAGATPILIHHYKQAERGEQYNPPELGNLAYSGIQEFARQWILIGRRSRFVPGSGFHDLWMSVGGSAGHSGEWAVDVNDGVMDADFGGRSWDVTVKSGTEIQAEKEEAKSIEKREKDLEKDLAKRAKLREYEDAVLEAVKRLGGRGTRTAICNSSGLSGTNSKYAIARLVGDGRLTEMKVTDARGKVTDGVGFPNPDNPDNP